MFKLFLLKIIFLEEFFFIKKVFKNTYVQGILCRYTLGCVLVGPMADGGTIGLQWRTTYWKH